MAEMKKIDFTQKFTHVILISMIKMLIFQRIEYTYVKKIIHFNHMAINGQIEKLNFK